MAAIGRWPSSCLHRSSAAGSDQAREPGVGAPAAVSEAAEHRPAARRGVPVVGERSRRPSRPLSGVVSGSIPGSWHPYRTCAAAMRRPGVCNKFNYQPEPGETRTDFLGRVAENGFPSLGYAQVLRAPVWELCRE